MAREIEVRDERTDEADKMAKLDSPDDEVYGYLSREVADTLGEYMTLTISEEADVMASLDGVTGSGTGNYARFETPGGAVTGLGISHDVWSDVFGREVERDDDGNVTNAPESIGLTFAESDADSYDEAEQADEEEVEGLIAGGSDDSDDEEEVEISDEELDLVES